jgi:hypothetical protein
MMQYIVCHLITYVFYVYTEVVCNVSNSGKGIVK